VDLLLTRNIARYPNKQDQYFSTSFWVKAPLILLTVLLIVFVAPHFTNIEAAKILIPFMAILVVFDALRGLFVAYLRGIERMEQEGYVVSPEAIRVMNYAIKNALVPEALLHYVNRPEIEQNIMNRRLVPMARVN